VSARSLGAHAGSPLPKVRYFFEREVVSEAPYPSLERGLGVRKFGIASPRNRMVTLMSPFFLPWGRNGSKIGSPEKLKGVVLKVLAKNLILGLLMAAILVSAGCVSCIPQYVAPPLGPSSTCYPVGHDPFIPKDHNPTFLNPWDILSSVAGPFLYGAPR
jgi:hypothetical protein